MEHYPHSATRLKVRVSTRLLNGAESFLRGAQLLRYQETTHILSSLKFRYHIHNSPPLALIQYTLHDSILKIVLIISFHQHLDLLSGLFLPVSIPNSSCVSLTLRATCLASRIRCLEYKSSGLPQR